MSHTAAQLESRSVKEVKAIASSLNLTPAFRKAACIQQILDFQSAQNFDNQVEEIALTDSEATVIAQETLAPIYDEIPDWQKEVIAAAADARKATCANCPHFTRYEGETNGRGWCHCFDRIAREHHAATSACPVKEEEEIAPVATLESSDIDLSFAAINIVPEPIIDNMDGSFDVLSSDRSRYYTVRAERCSCRAGQYQKPCRHTSEVAQFTTMLQSQEVESYLEAQVIEQWDIVEITSSAYGDRLLGMQARVADVFPDDLNLMPIGGGYAHMVNPSHVRLVEKAPKKVEVTRTITTEDWIRGARYLNRAAREYQYGRAINTLTGYGSYQLAR